MKETRFKRRTKGVVSLYMDLKLWYLFGLACEERETTRGKQVVKFIEARLAEWATKAETLATYQGDDAHG